MTVNQLVGRLGVQREGDEKGVVAPKGMSENATKRYNKWWGSAGTIVETPHHLNDSKAVYKLVK